MRGFSSFVLSNCLDKICTRQEICIDNQRHENGQDTRETAILADNRIAPRGFEPLETKPQAVEHTALTRIEDFCFHSSFDSLCAGDADLAVIVRAWAGLPADVKEKIKGLIEGR